MTDNIAHKLIQLLRTTAMRDILPHFRRLDATGIASKDSANDLVTIADRAAETRIAAAIADILPGAVIIGEEAVSAQPRLLDGLAGAELAVIIDPIDGTWNFARGFTGFGINLAVTQRGRSVFGLHYDPITHGWVEAWAGRGAFRATPDGARHRLRIDPSQHSLVGIVPAAPIHAPDREMLARAAAGYEKLIAIGCSCHEYWLLAEGAADFLVTDRLKPWDHAAGALIYTEAGGIAALLPDGAPYAPSLTHGAMICARNQAIWDQLAAKIRFSACQTPDPGGSAG